MDTSVQLWDPAREREARGRANEPNEDLRGPCDEAEHANDPRCTGFSVQRAADDDVAEGRVDDDVADDRGDDHRGSTSGPSDRSGRGGGEDHSGHGGGGDGSSGHGGDD